MSVILDKLSVEFNNTGRIFSVRDSISKLSGLNLVTAGEMIKAVTGETGLVLNLETDWTGIVMFDDNIVMGGDRLDRTFKTLGISVDLNFLGNVLNPLGNQLNKPNFISSNSVEGLINEFGTLWRNVELKAPGIMERQPVYETFKTGIISVDSVFPIGKGQRELIIGDRQTGKTTLAADMCITQSAVPSSINKLYFYDTQVNVDVL